MADPIEGFKFTFLNLRRRDCRMLIDIFTISLRYVVNITLVGPGWEQVALDFANQHTIHCEDKADLFKDIVEKVAKARTEYIALHGTADFQHPESHQLARLVDQWRTIVARLPNRNAARHNPPGTEVDSMEVDNEPNGNTGNDRPSATEVDDETVMVRQRQQPTTELDLLEELVSRCSLGD